MQWLEETELRKANSTVGVNGYIFGKYITVHGHLF